VLDETLVTVAAGPVAVAVEDEEPPAAPPAPTVGFLSFIEQAIEVKAHSKSRALAAFPQTCLMIKLSLF
jgi:hypothetical protein